MARPSITIESCSWIDFISVAYARWYHWRCGRTQLCTSLQPSINLHVILYVQLLSFSLDCQHLLWLHCSVSSMLRRGLWPIYVLVTMWREHYVIYIGFRSELGSHTNCAPWCMRLCMVLRRSTSETCWPRWLNCLVAASFCCVWIIRRATHTNEIWDQSVLS